jgi:hypothetical protein
VHAEHVVYRPKKIFSDASKSKRIYNEMWTGDWWNTVQVIEFTEHLLKAYFTFLSFFFSRTGCQVEHALLL